MRYLITFSYDGSKFSGYQRQLNALSVQEELEEALFKLSGKKVIVSASGRTDSGVHAINQKAHFNLDIKINIDELKKALNSLIPNTIYIKKVEIVSDDFHARFNVKFKNYIYKINIGEYDPLMKDYILQYNKKLDIFKMKKASKYLIGEHNYKAFSKTDASKEDYVRIIKKISFSKKKNIIIISFIGNGFLRYMVRNIVGLLIEVGSGKKNYKETKTILNSLDRTKAGITAKPNGLYLKDVIYK